MNTETQTVIRMHAAARPPAAAPARDATTNPEIRPAMRLAPRDNVLVARKSIKAGTVIEGENLTAKEDVPAGHKLSAVAIRKGEPILKFGTEIGRAAFDVPAGTRLHSHNIVSAFHRGNYRFAQDARAVELVRAEDSAVFQGFVRENGDVGTRNFIVIVCTVNCAATTSRRIADWFTKARLTDYPNVDGVIPLVHEIGCGMEMTGEPMDLLRRTIAGHIRNPNVAAALIVSLGCERNNVHSFMEQEKLVVGPKLKMMVMQEKGGTKKTIESGIAAIKELLPVANAYQRQPVPAKHLRVGLQCTGPDGFTGLSANPALGVAADLLVRQGATVILSRTSDVFGVLPSLTARAITPDVGQKLVDRLDWWFEYSRGRDTQINGRVNPAGQVGGLVNVVEASLGNCRISGTSPLSEVYRYAQPVTTEGLVFMDTPSDDAISVTGQIAGGANLICMTTGKGSVFGSLPAPTMKLAASTPMFEHMEDDMDLNCGPIIDGKTTAEQVGKAIFEQILRHASGEKTKGEELGAGENEFVPWPIGVFA